MNNIESGVNPLNKFEYIFEKLDVMTADEVTSFKDALIKRYSSILEEMPYKRWEEMRKEYRETPNR